MKSKSKSIEGEVDDDDKPHIAFRTNYRQASLCSRMFFTYTKHLMTSVRELGKMDESFIEDMNKVENETQLL